MSTSAPYATGVFASIRALGPALLGLLRTRLELFSIELTEEKARVVGLAVLGVCAALFIALALVLLNVLLIIAFWEQRVAVVAGLFVLYAVIALVLGLKLKANLAAQPMLFAATVSELQADLAALKGVGGASATRGDSA